MIQSNSLQNEFFNFFNQEILLKGLKEEFKLSVENSLKKFLKIPYKERFKYKYQCWSEKEQKHWDNLNSKSK